MLVAHVFVTNMLRNVWNQESMLAMALI